MRRRLFLACLFSGAAAPLSSWACPAGQVVQGNNCVPEFADPLQGGGHVVTERQPKLCLAADPYRFMTEDSKGRKTTEARWDYAFWHGGRAAPYDIGTVVTGQCYTRQRVKHGTIVINWFNCREAGTGRWIRYWSATKPIVDNGEYQLVIYHAEYVENFEAPPPAHKDWPLP